MSNRTDQNLKIAIDSESVNIYRENGEDVEHTHVCYWHEDEWLEDPEMVVPAILNAIELYYNNQVELLERLGLNDLILTETEVKPIREIGSSRSMSLNLSYNDIVRIVGEPNATDMDDTDKVKASWGFEDESGRKGFIWAYRYYGDVTKCKNFSADGDKELMKELFGENLIID